jgi:hypothetical protein
VDRRQVELRTHARGIAIKAGEQDLAGAWDLAAQRRHWPGQEWRRAARRLAGKTATVWKRSLRERATGLLPPPCRPLASFTSSRESGAEQRSVLGSLTHFALDRPRIYAPNSCRASANYTAGSREE